MGVFLLYVIFATAILVCLVTWTTFHLNTSSKLDLEQKSPAKSLKLKLRGANVGKGRVKIEDAEWTRKIKPKTTIGIDMNRNKILSFQSPPRTQTQTRNKINTNSHASAKFSKSITANAMRKTTQMKNANNNNININTNNNGVNGKKFFNLIRNQTELEKLKEERKKNEIRKAEYESKRKLGSDIGRLGGLNGERAYHYHNTLFGGSKITIDADNQQQYDGQNQNNKQSSYTIDHQFQLQTIISHKKTIALVALCRKSANFDKWLKYYLIELKFDLLILRIESCDTCRALIDVYGDKIIATYSSDNSVNTKSSSTSTSTSVSSLQGFDPKLYQTNFDKTHHSVKNNYHTMIVRQKDFVQYGLNICKEKNIDFLLHSDSDELLYVQPNTNYPSDYNNDIQQVVGKGIENHSPIEIDRAMQLRIILDQLPPEFDNIHLDNYEALYPTLLSSGDDGDDDDDNNDYGGSKCFTTDRFIRCKEGRCNAYVNGKGIARVNGRGWGGIGNVSFHGPHWFSGNSYDYSEFDPVNPELAILHFDSCTFQQWNKKFQLLKNINQTNLNDIPFIYYKESIRLQKSKPIPIQTKLNVTVND
jgi:hypothetical protein